MNLRKLPCEVYPEDNSIKILMNRSRVIFQGKNPVLSEIRPLVFASVPQSVFLVAASKTDVASKTKSL